MVTFTQDQIDTIKELTTLDTPFVARVIISELMNDLEYYTIYVGLMQAHNSFPDIVVNRALDVSDALEVPFTRRMLDTITNSAAVKAAL